MGEKIKKNISVILNILSTVIILGSLAMGYGQALGKIEAVEQQQFNLEKRQDRHDSGLEVIQRDVKSILCKVSIIEGKLSINDH